MNNDLMSLNNLLFEQIERVNDDSLSPEELAAAIKKANTVNSIANTIVANARLQFDALDKFGSDDQNTKVLIGIGAKN